MKSILLLLVSIPLWVSAQNEDTTGINFQQNMTWEEIKAKAKVENKYIFVDAYTTWCAPCKLMDKHVYTDSIVGDELNDRFISVKMQFDKTDNDDSSIKATYKDVQTLNELYNISAFPTCLFFAPDGQLVHRSIGFQAPDAFISTVRFAIDPARKEYYSLIDQYRHGIKNYKSLPALIKTTRQLVGDKNLAMIMAKDYKSNVLNKLSIKELCTQENIDFLFDYYELTTSTDNFFKVCYELPEQIDSLKRYNGAAMSIVNYVVEQEELEQKLWKNGKAVTKKPNWKRLHRGIIKKYSSVNADSLIFQYQTKISGAFYKRTNQWSKLAELTETIVQSLALQNPPDGFAINMIVWHNFFLTCDDKKALEKALKWSELSIKLAKPGYPPLQEMDTKANVLYKLGRIDEAVKLESKVVQIDEELAIKSDQVPNPQSDFKIALSKMQQGLPTWK